jgi:hypothetical protein
MWGWWGGRKKEEKKKHTQGKSVRKAVQAQGGKYPSIPGDKVFLSRWDVLFDKNCKIQ